MHTISTVKGKKQIKMVSELIMNWMYSQKKKENQINAKIGFWTK